VSQHSPMFAVAAASLAAWQPMGTSVPARAAVHTPLASAAIRESATARAAVHMSFMSKVKEINEANKMKTVRVAKANVRPAKMPAEVVDITQKFKKEYPKRDLELLWGAMLKIYGSTELAAAAAKTNPQIMNPSYTFCNTMLASEQVLVEMMGKEDALDVMIKNPAVLQCGPSLDTLGPDEIKGFANIRSLGTRLFPEEARGFLLSALLLFCLYPVLAVRVPELESSANIVKPLVGVLFAVLIEGSRIVIVGTILKGQVSGDERIKKAAENEARRMGTLGR